MGIETSPDLTKPMGRPSHPNGKRARPKRINNKELNMKLENHIALVRNDANVIEVPKNQVSFPVETSLPAICLFNDEENAGIATEYRQDSETFMINIDKNKVYSSTFFDKDNLNDEIGADLHLSSEGKLTSENGQGDFTFIKKEGDVILFKLK